MIFRYSSDNHSAIRANAKHSGAETMQIDLHDVKKGEYKIFI